MKCVLPDADETDYLISDLQLPDPDDRHVLAAAVAAKASVIVAWNLTDFPNGVCAYGIIHQSPDAFLAGLHALTPDAVGASLANARHNLRRGVPTVEDFHAVLDRHGLHDFIALMAQKS